MAKKLVFVSVVVCFLIVISLVVVPTALAQFAESTGTIQGTLKDPSGAVVPGAKVVLSGEAVAAGKTATTDNNGYFRFAQLPPGIYGITMTATGFRTYVESGLRVDVGKRITLDIELKVGAVTETVEVTAGAAQIDVTSSKAMVQITFDQIDAAPKPRGVLDLLSWAPGSRFEPAQGGFQMDGASASENSYAIEGQNTTSILNGLAGVNPPTDFFKEVTVKSSGYEAEHGGAMGGVVQTVIKSGGSAWHGTGMFYYRQSGLDARSHYFNRRNPDVSLGSLPPRFSPPLQTYNNKKDRYRIYEPGFELGGPIVKERLFLYTSYIPRLERNTRRVNITNPSFLSFLNATAPVPRTFSLTDNSHFAVSRLDGNVAKSLRAYAVWDYAYRRTEGTDRPGPDDIDGKTNTGARVDPRTRQPTRGQTLPNVLWRFGADWTPTPKLAVSGAYGKWFTDTQDRDTVFGIRHLFQESNRNFKGLDGTLVPTQFQNSAGFSDISDNRFTLFDAFARQQANVDASYTFRALGAHTVKGGYTLNRLSNKTIQRRSNPSLVDLFWGDAVTQTAPFQAGCAPVVAANVAKFGLDPARACRGNFGFYQVRDFQVRGAVSSNNHGIFIQDSWTVGWGVTVNGGVRFDREFLPAFNAGQPDVISAPIFFNFSDKVSPRIGAAWDVLRNGKLKVYGSWGWFYDIMKYNLPRGSFGGEFWHNCVFTLDTADFTQIRAGVKQLPLGPFSCNGGAVGQLPGTFLGEEDLRLPANTAQNINNVLDPNLQPVRQTEFTLGSEWAFTPNISFEVRWARKRLRNTIEDEGIFGPLGEQFIIVNPGERLGQFPLRGDCAVPGDPRCVNPLGIPTLPAMPKAVRKYDGVEFRINKRFTGNWYLNASYTWSRLFGNYSGLTNTDEDLAQTFGDPTLAGRSDPNTERDFDEQEIKYNASGKPEFGRLATDRPHTFKAFGGYRVHWWGMATTLGVNQQWYIGTPLGTRINFTDADIAVYVFGRGILANISQNPTTGAWILNGLQRDVRGPMFTNTDLSVTHEFKLSKTNEALRLGVNLNVLNLFNQAVVITKKDRTDRDRFADVVAFPDPTCGVPAGAPCASQSQQFRKKFFDGFDPIAAANDPVAGGVRLDSLYAKPLRIQSPRQLRLMLKVSF